MSQPPQGPLGPGPGGQPPRAHPPQQPGYPQQQPQPGFPQPQPGFGQQQMGGFGQGMRAGVGQPPPPKPASKPIALLVLLGIVAAWPFIMRVFWMLIPRSVSPMMVADVVQGLNVIVKLAAFIMFAIWSHGVFTRLNARGVQTKYSPTWAVGWWFIPLANAVMPMFVVKEAWTLLTRKGAALVFGWWGAYVAAIFMNMAWDFATRSGMGLPTGEGVGAVFTALSWSTTLVNMAAYGLWAVVVNTMSDAETAPALRY